MTEPSPQPPTLERIASILAPLVEFVKADPGPKTPPKARAPKLAAYHAWINAAASVFGPTLRQLSLHDVAAIVDRTCSALTHVWGDLTPDPRLVWGYIYRESRWAPVWCAGNSAAHATGKSHNDMGIGQLLPSRGGSEYKSITKEEPSFFDLPAVTSLLPPEYIALLRKGHYHCLLADPRVGALYSVLAMHRMLRNHEGNPDHDTIGFWWAGGVKSKTTGVPRLNRKARDVGQVG